MICFIGLLFPICYELAYTPGLPIVGKFIDGDTVWGEVFVGTMLGAVLTLLAY
jgi:hypothetical protein